MKKTRCLGLLMFAVVLVIGYALWVEPNRLVIRRMEIRDSVMARAWAGLTLVHLSDIHITSLGAREARLLAAIRGLKPDLIVMSGDYKQWLADPGPAQQFLSQLSAPLGVYGVLGDSDNTVNSSKGCAFCHPEGRYHERLQNPVILKNEMKSINWRSGTIDIAGIGMEEEEGSEPWLRTLWAEASRSPRPLLVLSHTSKRWQEMPLGAHSLWLCGDTHGGQVWMPDWLWRLIAYKPDSLHMGGEYDNGHGGWLIVNRGIGMTARFPFRLGVVPELLVITFGKSSGGIGQ